jgi:hypothetical protein
MSRECLYQALLTNKGLYDLRMAVSRVSRLKISVRISVMASAIVALAPPMAR